MGLFSFIKEKGAKIFGKKEQEAPVEEKKTLQAQALLDYVKQLGLTYNKLKLSVTDDDVKVEGEVAAQEDAEKIILAIGNVEGVDQVDNLMTVATPAPQAKFYTVVSGDTLSKISKEFYGDANKYNTIFEANKPMLTHPDKIYPGQVLRIPNL
ncbi:peptidoglycan-binding protein LysM [Paenimyroides baculatum]|jgi:nucleoid-associated protein YgaU|uniref:Potassium binding protein Kbp n=1 Tax=Paenimyroides baculatum TaxID=2608000 RepID=A0A5M6CI57_9FLAO|nr:peptidoglycan-binding protein LysM [Paenimyroides baculatum]KAA5533065.1 peptidoglycan-binding protein LysM [Paenimyroides baculatum]